MSNRPVPQLLIWHKPAVETIEKVRHGRASLQIKSATGHLVIPASLIGLAGDTW